MKTLRSLLLLLCASTPLLAQQPPASSLPRARRSQTCARPVVRSPMVASPVPAPTPAEFFVGEARVDVTRDETVVRLAMAQHASVLIELPANDSPRYIIPGDPEMATVDQKALERNKRAIVVRPGSQFLPPPRHIKTRTPAATVTAQMRSGLVVTFLFYPVENLAHNVHRCVLQYNRDEVVARRRAAGLPVNLEGTGERAEITSQFAAPTSISVEPESNGTKNQTRSAVDEAKPLALPEPKNESSFLLTRTPFNFVYTSSRSPTHRSDEKPVMTPVATLTREALEAAISQPKQFMEWTKPVHGLSLSVVQPPFSETRVIVCAVKNTTKNVLMLTPSTPDFHLELMAEDGLVVNVESVKPVHTEISDAARSIPANGTTYFAIAYEPPVLGANQRLSLSVSHTNAADQPASIVLSKE